MTENTFDTGTGDRYCLLGPALHSPDVWLVRHTGSQQLALLQRFVHPSATLAQLLTRRDRQLPRVQDSWTHQGEVYVVVERVDGAGLEELGTRRLSGQGLTQLKRLRGLLQGLGFQHCPEQLLCLTPEGDLRLRCFPSLQSGAQLRAKEPMPARRWDWLFWMRPLFGLFSRPQAA